MASLGGIDGVDRLIPQCTILGGLLASGEVQDRAGFGRVGKPDWGAGLEILTGPLGVDMVALGIILIGTRIASCCRLDILDQPAGHSPVQRAPEAKRGPTRIGGSLHLS